MQDPFFESFEKIKHPMFQNIIANILCLVGIGGLMYLLFFDEAGGDSDLYIGVALVAVIIATRVLARITRKEVENFLDDNPDDARNLGVEP